MNIPARKSKLKLKAKEFKEILSVNEDESQSLGGYTDDGEDVEVKMTRKDFEDICKKDFDKTLKLVKEALENAKIEKE